ncbi:hypothetical protein [Streptomyces sp. MCC20]|uniref:hypothetical protein n=1 Tax=Streptomyces sediminimaris TaxID=3383721 RepID=UPI00399C1CD9
MDVTPELLDRARAEADRCGRSVPLTLLQRRLRVSFQVAVAIAEQLEAEGRIAPEWRAREMGEALEHYGAAALALDRMSVTGTVEDGWPAPADIHDALGSWQRIAARLGAGAQELEDAVEAARRQRQADLAELENEVRIRDAVRTDVLDQVAEAINYDPDSAPW